MPTERLMLHRVVVFSFAVLYWATVWVQVKRVRRRIGRAPNVRPRGVKEKLLWAGWFVVVMAWLTLPWLRRGGISELWESTVPPFVHPLSLLLGSLMMAAGYALTLWCYVAMGDAWRMGVNQKDNTQLVTCGPYRWMRHPIYLSQLVMVTAIVVLLPSVFSLVMLAIQVVCVWTKASDEESHLRNRLGPAYDSYRSRTGWFP